MFFKTKVPIAWHNTFQNKRRTVTALGGITFSILLIFMQIGLLEGARRGATMLFDFFNFDLVIVSDKYQYLDEADSFDIMRLFQAKVVPGVDDASSLTIGSGRWTDEASNLTSKVLVFGVDTDSSFVANDIVREGLPSLEGDNAVMLDIYSHKDYGDMSIGRVADINGSDVVVRSHLAMGVTLFSDGAVVVGSDTYNRLFHGQSRTATIGMVRVDPGSDPLEVKRALEGTLPKDVLVFERNNLIRQEQDYYVSVKPVGILFQAGVLVAFIVGVVILFQVLSTDIANRLDEFATFKAMGFSNVFILGIGVKQALLFSVMSYIPSYFLTIGIFKLIQKVSHLPVVMTGRLALFVLLLTVCMCVISCVLALQKVHKTDPAELF